MMMGERQVDQGALFYEFSLERQVPADHMLRSIDRFVDLGPVRTHLAPFYSTTGRPSIDPELLIRMLIIGYCYGIRSERRLCEEVHLNLAYRWFCRLGLAGEVPDHSTFSKNRHGRFRASDLLRQVFEAVVRRCIAEGVVGGDGFAVDGSLIRADASSRKGVESAQGLAPEVTPKFISPADPAARWTGARGGQAFFAYEQPFESLRRTTGVGLQTGHSGALRPLWAAELTCYGQASIGWSQSEGADRSLALCPNRPLAAMLGFRHRDGHRICATKPDHR
jgi:transposase